MSSRLSEQLRKRKMNKQNKNEASEKTLKKPLINYSIEEIMRKSGWIRTTRVNAGKEYVEWIKEGFLIDEDDISREF